MADKDVSATPGQNTTAAEDELETATSDETATPTKATGTPTSDSTPSAKKKTGANRPSSGKASGGSGKRRRRPKSAALKNSAFLNTISASLSGSSHPMALRSASGGGGGGNGNLDHSESALEHAKAVKDVVASRAVVKGRKKSTKRARKKFDFNEGRPAVKVAQPSSNDVKTPSGSAKEETDKKGDGAEVVMRRPYLNVTVGRKGQRDSIALAKARVGGASRPSTPSAALTHHEGLLRKYPISSTKGAARDRFFVLRDGVLQYFTAKGGKLKGRLWHMLRLCVSPFVRIWR